SQEYRLRTHTSSARPYDGIDKGGLTGLHFCDGAPERWCNVFRILDRTFRVPSARYRELGEVRFGSSDILSDIRAFDRRAAMFGDVDLMLPIVEIGAVVVHHDQERNLVLGRGPKRAGVEHQVAVRLNVDHEPAGPAVRERDAQ